MRAVADNYPGRAAFVAISPKDRAETQRFWNGLQFKVPILVDPRHVTANAYRLPKRGGLPDRYAATIDVTGTLEKLMLVTPGSCQEDFTRIMNLHLGQGEPKADIYKQGDTVYIHGWKTADFIRVQAIAGGVRVSEYRTRQDFFNGARPMRSSNQMDGRNPVRELRFIGGDGDDVFHNQTSLRSHAWGGRGRDVLIGGRGTDSLRGGDEGDLLYSGGDRARDFLYGHGGPGPPDRGLDSLFFDDGRDDVQGDPRDHKVRGGQAPRQDPLRR